MVFDPFDLGRVEVQAGGKPAGLKEQVSYRSLIDRGQHGQEKGGGHE